MLTFKTIFLLQCCVWRGGKMLIVRMSRGAVRPRGAAVILPEAEHPLLERLGLPEIAELQVEVAVEHKVLRL